MTLEIDEPILHTLGKLADEHGVELYAVGGWVRDAYMGRMVQGQYNPEGYLRLVTLENI